MIEMTRQEIELLLANELLGRLAMAARDGRPYVIPLPFCWDAGALYLRLPLTGRKGRVLQENDCVCFEIDRFSADLCEYASVLIEGRLVTVEDLEEKRRIKLANEAKYRRLRGSSRLGHRRATTVEDLPLRKVTVVALSGRRNSDKRVHSEISPAEDLAARSAKHPNAPANIKADVQKLVDDLMAKKTTIEQVEADLQAHNKAAVKADRQQLKAECATTKTDRQTLKADRQAHKAARKRAKN